MPGRGGGLGWTLVVACAWSGAASAQDRSPAPEGIPAVVATFPGGAVTWEELEREASRIPPMLRRQLFSGSGGELLARTLAFRHRLLDAARQAGLMDLAGVEARDPELQERLAIRWLLGAEARRRGAPAPPDGSIPLGHVRRVFASLYAKLGVSGVQVDQALRRPLEIQYTPAVSPGGSTIVAPALARRVYLMPQGQEPDPECEVLVDAEHRRVLGTCGRRPLEARLEPVDLLFFELYLSGDEANILYRYNLEGLYPARATSSRPEDLSLDWLSRVERVGEPLDPPRPFDVQRAQAFCTVSPAELTQGTIKFCQTEACAPPDVIKAASLSFRRGGFVVQDIASPDDMSTSDIFDQGPTGVGEAHRFAVALPVHLVQFEGFPAREDAPKGVWCRLEPVEAGGAAVVKALGLPRGTVGP